MINGILAWTPGFMKLVIIFFVFIVPVLLVVLFIVFVRRNTRKRREVQMQLGRLADELEQVREQATRIGKSNPQS